eukprot:5722901-Amphidinium_carterae.1
MQTDLRSVVGCRTCIGTESLVPQTKSLASSSLAVRHHWRGIVSCLAAHYVCVAGLNGCPGSAYPNSIPCAYLNSIPCANVDSVF